MKKLMMVMMTIWMTGSAAFAETPFKNGKVILMITLEVNNVSEWKVKFDAGAPVREKAGIKVLSVCSDPLNEKTITVIEEAENAQAAHDFMLKLKAAKEKSGDTASIKEVKLLDKVD